MASLSLLLLLACGSLLSGSAAAAAECSCPLTAQAPVCADGLTFFSRCAAECQGAAITSEGPCPQAAAAQAVADAVAAAGDAALAAAALEAVPGVNFKPGAAASATPRGGAVDAVGKAVMDRFRSEGFRLVAAAAEDSFAPDLHSVKLPPAAPAAASGAAGGAGVPPASPHGALAVRKTADGFVYQLSGAAASPQLRAAAAAAAAALAGGGGGAAAVSKAVSDAFALSEAASVPGTSFSSGAGGAAKKGDKGAGRRLAASGYIIGDDDREERVNFPGWPYTAVGHLLFSKGSCTGAMVGPRAVVTAASCVYSRKAKAWQDKITFTPYRHRTSNETDNWPLGRVAYEHVTTFLGFLEADGPNAGVAYNLAVIHLAEDIGAQTGWFGMSFSPKGYKGPVFTAGYPVDKPFGSLWSASCRANDAGDGLDGGFTTLCDVSAGQGGSPIWSSRDAYSQQLRAVVTHEQCRCCDDDCTCCTNKVNGGNAINGMNYAAIQAWK